MEGLSPAVSEALGDPIVRALMTADRIDRASLEGLLRTAAAKLAARDYSAGECHRPRFCGEGRA